MIFLPAIICALLFLLAWGGSLGKDDNIDQNGLVDLEERLFAQLMEQERETEIVPTPKQPETSDTTGKEVQTVEKLGSGRTRIDITLDSKLIEQHLQDCEQKYEIIVMNDESAGKRNRACYMYAMEKDLLEPACQGKGGKVHRVYNIGEEIVNKDFLSKDGADSVCRNIPMFMITVVNDQNQDLSSRELQVAKRCRMSCGITCNGGKCGWSCNLVC